MKRLASGMILAVCLSLCSCVESLTTMTVHKDGRGDIEQTVYVSGQLQAMMQQMAAGLGGEGAEAPDLMAIDEEKLRRQAAEMGEGVRFVEARQIEAKDGRSGVRALFSFEDVRKLHMQPDRAAMDSAGAVQMSEGEAAGEKKKPITFGFDPGRTARLTVRIPHEKGPADGEQADTPPAKPDRTPSEQEMAMISQAFDGFRARMIVRVDGDIVRTDAAHRSGSEVTLFDLNLGKLLKEPDAIARLQALGQIRDMTTALTRLQSIPELKIEPKKRVEVLFR